MKKVFFCLGAILLIACMLFISAFAADKTVYVGADKEASTLEEAIEKLDGEGGTIILCDTVSVTKKLTIPEQSQNLTVTSQGGSLSYTAESLTLEKNTNGNTVTFDMPLTTGDKGLLLFGGFNSIVFGENFDVSGMVNFYGGVDAADADAGNTKNNYDCITELPYNITVKNGNFGVFNGGNRRSAVQSVFGSIAEELNVLIEGGTFTYQGTCALEDPLKIEQAFSLSGMSILADDATLTIKGGTFNTPIYAVGYWYPNKTEASAGSQITNSSAKYYAMDGNITIDIQGGVFTEKCYEISAAQTAAGFNLLLRGNYTLNVGANATLANGTVLDATQVKAYSGESKFATLNYENAATVVPKRFDNVLGTTQEPLEEPLRIACIGDSITQGTNSGNFGTKSYPAQLLTKVDGENREVIISNFGCGGWTVMNYDGKYYPDGLAYTLSVNETDPDIVIVGLGTNDSRTFNTVGQHDHFCQEYKKLILAYTNLESTEKVYGTSAIYRFDKLSTEASQFVRRHQEEVFQELVNSGNTKAVYVDLYELLLEDAYAGNLLSSDNLHPNSSGYAVYANAIYDVLFGSGTTRKPVEKRTEIYVDSVNGTQQGAGTKEDPTKYLANAFEMADRDADEVTIFIVGTYYFLDREETTDTTNTPYDLKKLRIVGVPDASGNKAKWSLSSKYLYFNCDTELDNIILDYSRTSSPAIYIYCCFNNVTFTETFETASSHILFAGHNVYNEDATAKRYTPAYSVSSDKDVTLNILGGNFFYFYGGNRHYPSDNVANKAPYGTYGGNMVINIGEGVTFSSKYTSAINGMNYLTGTITANIGAWNPKKPILEYSPITENSTLAATYNETKNTGKIVINPSENVTNPIALMGDLNNDGSVNIADLLMMLRYVCGDDQTGYDSSRYYDRTAIEILHVVRMLKKISQ